jgi:hypothetical protein
MLEPSFLDQLGVSLRDIVAGFCGGVVNALVFRRTDPWSFVGSVVVGSMSAAYITPVIGHYTGTTGGSAAFFTGLTGMAFCQTVVNAAKNWRLVAKPKGTSDGGN